MHNVWHSITFFAHLPLAVPPSRAICQGHALHSKRLVVGLQRYRRTGTQELSLSLFSLRVATADTAQES